MAASIFASGFNGAMTISSGTQLPLINWSLARTAQIQTFKNSLTGPFPVVDPTFQNIVAQATIDRDFGNNPNIGGYGLGQGATISNIYLIEREATRGTPITSGPVHLIGSAVITSAPVKCDVDGKVGYSFTFQITGGYLNASGVYTPPTT